MLEFILEIKSYSSHAYNVLKPPFPHGEDAYNDDEFSHFNDDEEFEGFNKNEDPEDPDEFYSEPKAKNHIPHGEDAYIAPKPPLPRGEDAYNDDEFSHFNDDEEFEGFNKNEDPEDPDEFYSEPKAKKQDKVTPSPSPSSLGFDIGYCYVLM